MTLWDLFGLVWRRWYVTVAGLLLTGLALSFVLSSTPLYFGQVRVVVLPPSSPLAIGFAENSDSLVDLAGVVARSLQGSSADAEPVSDAITLVGQGVTEGFSIQQRNSGGQWQYRFDEPVLDIQAVGSSPEIVRAQVNQGVETVLLALENLQEAQGVAVADRVRTQLNPPEAQILEKSGSEARAVAATVVAGILATLGVLAVLGPRSRRRLSDSDRRGTHQKSART